LAPEVTLNAAAGYSFDRFADGGLFVRAEMDYDITPAWVISASAAYAEINSRGTGGGAVTSAGVALRYRTSAPGTFGDTLKSGSGG
jgi:hypothetical protein